MLALPHSSAGLFCLWPEVRDYACFLVGQQHLLGERVEDVLAELWPQCRGPGGCGPRGGPAFGLGHEASGFHVGSVVRAQVQEGEQLGRGGQEPEVVPLKLRCP